MFECPLLRREPIIETMQKEYINPILTGPFVGSTYLIALKWNYFILTKSQEASAFNFDYEGATA